MFWRHWRLRREPVPVTQFVLTDLAGRPFRPDWDSAIYFRDGTLSVATAETVWQDGQVLRLGHFAIGTQFVGRGAGRAALLSLAAHLEAADADVTSIDLDLGRQLSHVDPDRLRAAREDLLQWLGVPSSKIQVTPKHGIHSGQWRVQGRWQRQHWQVQRLPEVWARYRALADLS